MVLLERPRLSFSYDTDKTQSAESRVKHLGMLADERIPILAYHFPWPGIGNVVRSGDGFRFIPRPMALQDVTFTQDYTWNETLVLGKAREEDLLRDAIVSDLVRTILKQISSL